MYTMVLTYHSLFQIFTQPNISDTQDHFDYITAAQDLVSFTNPLAQVRRGTCLLRTMQHHVETIAKFTSV